MQTFDLNEAPIIPPHCLWVAGLLLESGSRVSAGLPRLHRARQTVGNRLAMGDKVPGAWGAPGTDLMQEMAAGLALLWAGEAGTAAVNSQMTAGSVSVQLHRYLLAGAVPREGVPCAEVRDPSLPAEAGRSPMKAVAGAHMVPAETATAHAGAPVGAGHVAPYKQKVQFIPKPDPWNGTHGGGGNAFKAGRPISFCRKIVTFSPASSPGR